MAMVDCWLFFQIKKNSHLLSNEKGQASPWSLFELLWRIFKNTGESLKTDGF